MNSLAQRFIQFSLRHQALKFGEFTLKSGRKSPYFFNMGAICQGAALAELGQFYAQAIQDAKLNFQVLFGPAYKGIPLATATAIALAEHHQVDIPYCFNRKEIKDHGEGGQLVGAELSGRVLIVDDVITAGTAFREAKQIIVNHQAELAGLVIALDRQERGADNRSAIAAIEQDDNIPVISLAGLADLIVYCGKNQDGKQYLPAIEAYQHEYGVR